MPCRPALVALALCLPTAAPAEGWEVALGTASAHHLRHAGGALYASFFGEDPRRGDDFDLSDLTSQPGAVSTTNARQWSLRRTGLLHDDGARLRYRAGLTYGTATVDMPGGLGIFTDPARAQVQAWSLTATLIADGPPLRIGPADLRLGAEMGAVATTYRARLTSALLDIRASDRMATPFVGIGLELGAALGVKKGSNRGPNLTPARPRVGLRAGGRAYGNGLREARLELFAGF